MLSVNTTHMSNLPLPFCAAIGLYVQKLDLHDNSLAPVYQATWL